MSYRERVEAIRTGGTLAGQKVRLRCIDIAAEADAELALFAMLEAHLDTGESVVLGRNPMTGARQVSIAGRVPATVEGPTLAAAIRAALSATDAGAVAGTEVTAQSVADHIERITGTVVNVVRGAK